MRCIFNPSENKDKNIIFTHKCSSCGCILALSKEDFIGTTCICCTCSKEIKFNPVDFLKYEWFNYKDFLNPYHNSDFVITLEEYESKESSYSKYMHFYYGYEEGYLNVLADSSWEWLGYKVDKPTHVVYFGK